MKTLKNSAKNATINAKNVSIAQINVYNVLVIIETCKIIASVWRATKKFKANVKKNMATV